MTNSSSKQRVNSQIMGAFVNDPVLSVKLNKNAPANFTFQHLVTDGVSNPVCVYWEVLEGKWSREGCSLIESNRTVTKCSCNHLTSFAILMDFTDSLAIYGGQLGKPRQWQARVLDLLTVVGCSISIVCLAICVLIFTVFRLTNVLSYNQRIFSDLSTTLEPQFIETFAYVY
jgi:hypothetical protein